MSTITRLRPAYRSFAGDLETASGQKSRMVWIPRFTCQSIHESLGTGTHPAFIVDGTEVAGFWAGMYAGTIRDGELLSVEGADPTVSTNFDNFSAAARECGPGWHLMTAAEWAAITLWSLSQGMVERGNDQWGRAHNETSETGRRADGGPVGISVGHGRVHGGSGPDTWRHDNTGEGIADLVGNVTEWVGGLRLDAGDLQILPDNNAATGDLAAGSTDWVSTGLSPEHNSGAWFRDVDWRDEGTDPADGDDLELLRRLAMAPLDGLVPSPNRGRLYHNLTAERLPRRGGHRDNASNAGWFNCSLSAARTSADVTIGARPAFVEL